MDIPLPIHLSLHVFLSLLAGLVAWRIWKRPFVSFAAAVAGGVLIDLDHLIDYFLAFGFNWHLSYFLQGKQFLEHDKVYVLFHGWEYVAVLMVIGYLVRNVLWKSILFAFALSMFFHLMLDVNINGGMTIKSYSILYRAAHHFNVKDVVTEEHYKEHMELKELLKLKE